LSWPNIRRGKDHACGRASNAEAELKIVQPNGMGREFESIALHRRRSVAASELSAGHTIGSWKGHAFATVGAINRVRLSLTDKRIVVVPEV
jgi:hypothetical protein